MSRTGASAAAPNPAERILMVAPLGADAENMGAVLANAGLQSAAYDNVSAVASEIARGCGAVLLTQEALNYPRFGELAEALDRQPPWSDIPLVLILTGGHAPHASAQATRLIGTPSNVMLLERPLRAATLLSTLHAALRARRRQYEVSDLLRERDELLTSLEQRVAERTAKLEELNSQLEAFSYSVSHDLRAPLRSLETYAKILCDEFNGPLSEEGRYYAERIARNAEKMDRLTRDVLALSRLTRSDIQVGAFDLDQVMRDVIDQYPDLAAAQRHIEIRSPLGRVLANGPLLTQCFSNLMQNALKFIPPGQTAHISVYSETRDARLVVSFQDNGIGIDPAHHTRIFGMFERAGGAKFAGTGIGLAIAKKAVERMDGAIGVESSLGAGARFWVELPCAEVGPTGGYGAG